MYFKVKATAEFEMEVEAKDAEQAVQRASNQIKSLVKTTEVLPKFKRCSYFFTLKTRLDDYLTVKRIKPPSEE